MNWSYIAGLFDGDGSVGIARRPIKHGSTGVYILIYITSSNVEFLLTLSEWMKKRGISANVVSRNNTSTPRLQIGAFDSLKNFVKETLPYVILKKRRLEIILEALELKEKLKNDKNQTIMGNLPLFNEMRHELHSLAMKGPKKLIAW